jgi:hypothetical protein
MTIVNLKKSFIFSIEIRLKCEDKLILRTSQYVLISPNFYFHFTKFILSSKKLSCFTHSEVSLFTRLKKSASCHLRRQFSLFV